MSIYKNDTIVKIGNFFFKYRNKVFPLVIGVLFLIQPPYALFRANAIEGIKDGIAILLSLSGLLVRALVIGFAYIKRGGVNKQVFADKLVTEGMFTICRNPLYYGNMLIYVGIFLFYGTPLAIVVGSLLFYFIYICIIATEERYLRNKFGAEYDVYEMQTNRWIIDFTQFRTATKGMFFNFRKVIIKDYPTIFTTFLIILFIEQYKLYITTGNIEISLIIASLLCVAMMGAVRYLKKRKILTFE